MFKLKINNMGIVRESRKYALSEIEKFGFPDLALFEISEKKAIELAEELKADKKIVQMGVYLMDLKLGQAFKDNKVSQHIKMSITAAEDLLKNLAVEETIREKVINCIEAHHGEVPFKSLEAEICANTDCYRFIHPKGFFLYLILLGRSGLTFNDCLKAVEEKLDEKYKLLSLEICKEELEDTYWNLKRYIAEARKL